MKKNPIIRTLAAAAIITLAACQNNEPLGPEADRVQAVITASIEPTTRTEPGTDPTTGYDGPVKKTFVQGDEIDIRYLIGGKIHFITATLDAGGQWTTPTDFYIDPDYIAVGSITAHYMEDIPTNPQGITTFHDDLHSTAIVTPPAPGSEDPYTIDLGFIHDLTLLTTTVYIDGQPAAATDIASIIIYIDDFGMPFKIAPGADGRCIALDGSTVQSIDIALAGGSTYTLIPDATITFIGNETYDLNIRITTGGATIDIGQSDIPAWETPNHVTPSTTN